MMPHRPKGWVRSSRRILLMHLPRPLSARTIAAIRFAIAPLPRATLAIRWNCLSFVEFRQPTRTSDLQLRLFRAAVVGFVQPATIFVAEASAPGRGYLLLVWLHKLPRQRRRRRGRGLKFFGGWA